MFLVVVMRPSGLHVINFFEIFKGDHPMNISMKLVINFFSNLKRLRL